MTLDDLAGRNFASPKEVARLLDDADARTVRRMVEQGEIPSIRVGNRIMIPVSWLRENLSIGAQREAVDLDQLADRLADRLTERVAARILGAFAALAPTPDMPMAGLGRPAAGQAERGGAHDEHNVA